MNNRSKELRVGIFVIIGIVLFSIVVFSVGDMHFFLGKGYRLKLIFGYVGGLQLDAPVRLTGIKVGTVQGIKRYYDSALDKDQVEVLVWLKGDVKIRQNAQVYINMLGMLGEKYIEIFSSGTKESPLLKSGDKIVGYDPIPIERITRINQETLIALHDILGSKETKSTIKDILSNTRDITQDLKDIIAGIKAGKGTIGKLVVDDELYQNLEDFSADIKAHPWRLLKKDRVRTKDKASGSSPSRRRSITGPY